MQPNKHGNQTVIMGMEDGPADLGAASINSQVYMYVGTKVRSSASVLRRNGLDNGTLYVLAPVNAAQSSEDVFRPKHDPGPVGRDPRRGESLRGTARGCKRRAECLPLRPA